MTVLFFIGVFLLLWVQATLAVFILDKWDGDLFREKIVAVMIFTIVFPLATVVIFCFLVDILLFRPTKFFLGEK